MAERAVQTALFPTLFSRPLVATFDAPQQRSDGAILLKADPLHTLLGGRDPRPGPDLASQPCTGKDSHVHVRE